MLYKKLNIFFHVLYHSLIPVDDYYIKIRSKTHFSFSFKYFVSLIFLFTSILVIFVSLYVIREFPPSVLRGIFQQTVSDYPNDLRLSLNSNGRLLTNYDKPYFMFYKDAQQRPLKLVFVIDTKAEPKKIFEYQSRFLFTERKLVFQWNQNIYALPYFETGSPILVNKSSIGTLLSNLSPLLDHYYAVLLLFSIFAILTLTILFSISKMLYLSFISVVVFFISIKFYPSLTFKKTYHIGLHSLTGPIAIEFTTIALGIKPPFTFWFLLLSFIFMFASLREAFTKERMATANNILPKKNTHKKKTHR